MFPNYQPGQPNNGQGAPGVPPSGAVPQFSLNQPGQPMYYGAPMAGRPTAGVPPLGVPPMNSGVPFGTPPSGAPIGIGGVPMSASMGSRPPIGGPPMGSSGPPSSYGAQMGAPTGYIAPMGAPAPAGYGAPMGSHLPMGGAPIGGPPSGFGSMSSVPPSGGPPIGGVHSASGSFPGQGYNSAMHSTPTTQPPSNPPMPKPQAQFYSMSGGAPQPVAAHVGPPASTGGPPGAIGMGAHNGIAPPPTGQPGVGMPPPPSYAGQQYGAPPPNSMQGMPNAFSNPMDGSLSLQHPNVAGPAGGLGPSVAESGTPLPTLEEIDLTKQCDKKFIKSSVGRIVNTQAAAGASKLPLGVVVTPMAGDVGVGNDGVEVVDFGATGIVRCKRCRTYINPFASFVDGGRRWKCNMCGMLNDVGSSYYSQLDVNGRRRDLAKRPELNKCTVEFVAPGDYMVRPPQPPVYFFCIDVSMISQQSGMLTTASEAIKESLEKLRAYPRVQVGFVTFDSTVHFYNLKSTLKAPQMLVAADINEILIPHITDDLLVPLEDSKDVINTFLGCLPTMFASSQVTAVCTGPALQACKRVMKHLGGKLVLFQSSLPSLGEGSLKQRENQKLVGTGDEHKLLCAENDWYKENGIDYSRFQICVDVFLFAAQYTDVSTLSRLAKITGGSVYYYPNYSVAMFSQKFHQELTHNLTRPTGFEAVMRVRATRGIRIANFYGNHYIRGQDLLALPNCTSDSSFAIDFAYDEPVLSASAITVQAALLYTSSAGERRIRVHTMVIPVTQSLPDMVNSLDINVAVTILSKQAVDLTQKIGMEPARKKVHECVTDIIRAAKMGSAPHQQFPQYGAPHMQMSTPQELPSTLHFLPLYALSLLKNIVMRGGNDIRIDERAYHQQLMENMTVEQTMLFIYPKMFAIHDMDGMAGRPCDNPDETVKVAGPLNVCLPATVGLSYENLSSDSIVLLDNGSDLYLWIGSNANPLIIQSLFGLPSLVGLSVYEMSMLELLPDSDEFSSRFFAIVSALRAERPDRFMTLKKIREGEGFSEAQFGRHMVEDRANWPGGTHTYAEYHSMVSR